MTRALKIKGKFYTSFTSACDLNGISSPNVYRKMKKHKLSMTKAIESIMNEKIEIIGSGRTDAGVHALAQVANFHTNTNIEIEKIPYAINSKLTKSIVITKAEEVEERFHSRYNCKKKT